MVQQKKVEAPVSKILQSLDALALVLLCALLALGLYMLWPLRHDGQVIHDTLRDAHVTILEAGLTLKNLREASATWEQASKEQSTQTTVAMRNVSVAVGQFSSFILSTEKEFNGQFLPTLQQAVKDQNAALLTSQKDLQDNLKEIVQTTQQLQKTLADADKVIADPAIKESLDHLATASQNAAEATKHLDNVTADAEKTADYYTKRLTTPQGFLKTLVQAILQLGSEARILVGK
jgi:hypothetical protein